MSDDRDDYALVVGARDGDDRSFRALVDRHQHRVAAVVIRMLGPGHEADDVGQETFVRFFGALDAFRGDAAVGTYLTRIAMNLSLNALKRRKRRTERYRSLDAEEGIHLESTAPHPADEVVEKEEQDRIEAALNALSADHRAVVVLRIREGHSTAEVSEMLDVPPGTVMSRLKRALAKLRETLDGERDQ